MCFHKVCYQNDENLKFTEQFRFRFLAISLINNQIVNKLSGKGGHDKGARQMKTNPSRLIQCSPFRGWPFGAQEQPFSVAAELKLTLAGSEYFYLKIRSYSTVPWL